MSSMTRGNPRRASRASRSPHLPFNPPPYLIPTLSFIIQLILIAYGEYRDANFEVKYTDVDYRVFSDAVGWIYASHEGDELRKRNMAEGWLTKLMGWNIGDPYNRATFRYTPLLPLILSPMALSSLHPQSHSYLSKIFGWIPWHLFGKVVFSVVGSWGVHGLLLSEGKGGDHQDQGTSTGKSPSDSGRSGNSMEAEEKTHPPSYRSQPRPEPPPKPTTLPCLPTTLLWTLNPMILNINTRGSSESILAFLVLLTLVSLKRSRAGQDFYAGPTERPSADESIGVTPSANGRNPSSHPQPAISNVLPRSKRAKKGPNLNWTAVAGALWAISIGWKVYPIVYGTSIWGWMYISAVDEEDDDTSKEGEAQVIKGQNGMSAREKNKVKKAWWTGLVTKEMVVFGLSAGGTFGLMTFGLWSIWGYPFLYHSYIYHIHRLDHRHNFSAYFYPIYLSLYPSASDPFASSSFVSTVWTSVSSLARHPLAAFVPQASATLLAGLVIPLRSTGRVRSLKRPGLELAWFVQTWCFVMFNKVCTSQYFLWFIFLLPPILPRLHLSRRRACLLVSLWIGAQALWLSIAYRLEFLGQSAFLQLWAAGIVFLLVNAYIIGEIVGAYR